MHVEFGAGLGVADRFDGQGLLAAAGAFGALSELRVEVVGEPECHRHGCMMPRWYQMRRAAQPGADSKKVPDVLASGTFSFWWLGPGSNRRPIAFQAIARTN